MKAEDFVNFVNQSIDPESGLRHITMEDLRLWTEMRFFKHAPEYYRSEWEIVIGLLKHEADLEQRLSSPLAQRAKAYRPGALEVTFRRGIVQVVSCVGSGFVEEQLISRGLKETNLIASAGQVAVNFAPFSRKPVDIPNAGAQAKEGDLLIIEFDDSGGLQLGPAVTPLGKREFTPDDTLFRSLWSLHSERKPELLSEIEQQILPKTTKRIELPWPPEKKEALTSTGSKSQKRFARSLFTFPIFVPIMTIKGVPATMVDLTYIAPNGQRIPPLRNVPALPSRLYAAFLDTDGSLMHKIINFMTTYDISLRFRFSSTGDPQKDFLAEQQKMRQLLAEARSGNLHSKDIERLSPLREDALVERDFIEDLLSAPDYADYISELRRASGTEKQEPKFLPVRRYYSWVDYMWAEMLEDIGRELIPPLCKRCGAVIPVAESRRGRPKEYCPQCDDKRARARERFRRRKAKPG